MIGAAEIVTLFIITLGPIKLLGPFVAQTRGLEPPALRGIALRVFILSVVAMAIGGTLGSALAFKWGISRPALLITTGVLFFLVALRLVLEQYEPTHEAAAPALPAEPLRAALKFTFPTVVTPYGIAALIVLLAATQDTVRQEIIWLAALATLALNLVAMLFARQIMRGVLLLGMFLLGAVLGVLQVALAVEIILRALRELQLI